MGGAGVEGGRRGGLPDKGSGPMERPWVGEGRAGLAASFGGGLVLRAWLEHYTAGGPDDERGPGRFETTRVPSSSSKSTSPNPIVEPGSGSCGRLGNEHEAAMSCVTRFCIDCR